MCGIIGISCWKQSLDLKSVLSEMSARIAHRGPDDQGCEINELGTVGVAHRRLSINDLSANGRQPFVTADGSLALVCNGEIYNHQDLRAELNKKGHCFTSDSDNEVILHLYEEYGDALVHKLKGMFAFAITNLRTGEVFCARDPLGKKPLYYTEAGDGFAFASEIPALKLLPGIDLGIDQNAIALYLLRNLRHIPDPLTIFKSIRSLSPGHWMKFDPNGSLQIQHYWQPDLTSSSVKAEDVLGAFDRAVALRGEADVEVAALLSGGVDSSAIVDALTRQGAKNLQTFAFGRDAEDEEILRARRVSDRLRTKHTEIYFDPDQQHDQFEQLMKIHGQPIAALPLTHAMMLFQEIQRLGIKVVMTGHGADEVFYGYDGAGALARFSNWETVLANPLGKTAAKLLSKLFKTGPLGEALTVLGHNVGERKAALYREEARRVWPQLFSCAPEENVVTAWNANWFSGQAPAHYIDEAAYLGLMQENAHAITIAGDLPAMAHGIEVRCPFLDRDLVEMGLSIPYADKRDAHGGKAILKRALKDRLGPDVLYAPKRGFGFFVQEDTVLRGAWKSRVERAFDDFDDFGGLLNMDAIQALRKRFNDSRSAVPPILMAKLYALQCFARL